MKTLSLILLGVCCLQVMAEPLQVGSAAPMPGQMASGNINIEAAIDDGTQVPVTVVRGRYDGPVLALIAGTHGYEYPPITALHRIRQSLDSSSLRGTVIMVHVANMPSFLGRTIYYSPVDGENLNRVYPGKPDGTVSQRIAHAITTEVIDKADFLIDLHSGDGNEALRPYVYMPVTGSEPLDAASRELAVAFGLDHIVIDRRPLTDMENSLYTDHTALVRGIPAITTETGQLGSNDDHWVDLAENGIWNVMRHLDMIDGDPVPNDGITWLTDGTVIRTTMDGIFIAAVKDGYHVAEGALLGRLVDYFGDELLEFRAPFAGVVNYVIGTPPVSEGEPVAMVSKIHRD